MFNPNVSIIIATFNSERTLGLCLKKVAEQVYDKKKIEIIIADGGSRDSTLQVAKKYGAKIIQVDSAKQNAEYNKGIGLKCAKGEIVLFLDHDNIMPHVNWLKNIIQPFLEDKSIIGSEPLRFHYDSKMTFLDRYFALIGGSDPVVYYLGKNSHLSWANDKYNLFGNAKDMGKYYKVTYLKKEIPALGGNGAALRREILLRNAKADPDNFVHTDVVADLIRAGYNKYGIVKDTIIHLTNNKVLPFLIRRKYFIEKYQLQYEYTRRYHMYDPAKDKLKLLRYIVFSLTIVFPTYDAIKGFYKVRDLAWFLHPFMCLAFVVIYSIPVLKGGLKYVILGK
jgi:glycosyltransferase involved in cell wall biosynthesis